MTTAFLVITDKCHLDCEFCFYRVRLNRDKRQQPRLEELRQLPPVLQALGVSQLVITGGEPFLRNDILEIISLFSAEGLIVGVLTAGALLNPEKLRDVRRAGAVLLCLPVDGPFGQASLQRPSQDNVVPLCREAKHIGMLSSISVTLTTRNYRYVNEIYRDLVELVQPDNIVFSPVSIGLHEQNAKFLSLEYLPPTEKAQMIQDLKTWAVDYRYEKYLKVIELGLLDKGTNFWPHCTMKDKIVIESDGSLYTCFSKATPVIGHFLDEDVASTIQKFKSTFTCKCSSDQCVTQFQRKDWEAVVELPMS